MDFLFPLHVPFLPPLTYRHWIHSEVTEGHFQSRSPTVLPSSGDNFLNAWAGKIVLKNEGQLQLTFLDVLVSSETSMVTLNYVERLGRELHRIPALHIREHGLGHPLPFTSSATNTMRTRNPEQLQSEHWRHLIPETNAAAQTSLSTASF